jgi:hypothetical protein
MFVAQHRKTLKSALSYMPATAVMLVITPYVTGQEPLHESAQRLVMRSFNHKVKMIRHQASGSLLIFFGTSDFPTSSLSRLQRLERSAAIDPSIDSGQASGTFGTGASQNSPEVYER